MIVERTENPVWLSNAYLVADPERRTGVLIDGNDELGPLLERAEREGIEITHVLVTHPHGDHIAGLPEARAKLGNPPLVAHAATAAELDDEVEVILGDGDVLDAGGIGIEAIFTPGHAAGHLAYLIEGEHLFTADVLFKGTVGGTMAPGAGGFDDLKASVMRLMELHPETLVHPGHREATTIGAELAENPFVRIWRGLDATGEEEVTVWGRPATMKLWAPDYDGGNKAWIVFGDSGEEAIVGGSQVERG
ncbi:MAG: hydroxyacylglutathione hydrolase [Solirubrobacterales bacterium]|nr:hydroxyacylglutathione hydrolase [Solirubrobacterales bacterium]